LQEEVTRSTNADNKLTRDLSTESTTARAAEKKNADNIASNTQAIQKEVTDRNAAIKVETDRATIAESNKVDKIVGKGLSTNDYTTNEKNKLAGIASGAEVNVQSDWNQTDINSDDYIKNKPVAATTSKDGFMSAADKTKLDGIA
jgi:hypothetical protein